MSLAARPKRLIETPPDAAAGADRAALLSPLPRKARGRARVGAAPHRGAVAASDTHGTDDVLSSVLATIRLSGSVQFCVAAEGAWQTEGKPALKGLAGGSASVIPFHIVADGGCWLDIEGHRVVLEAGDIVAFPF